MNEVKPVKKRKWWLLASIGVGGVFVLVFALVALAPTLVSAGLFRSSIESAIGGAVNGTARIGSLSVAWFGQQQVTGLELRDAKGETDIKLDLKLENALFDLAVGSVDSIRATVSGSVQARMLPGGGTSLSNLAASSSAPAAPKPSTSKASGNPLEALRFPVKLTIGSFDAVLSEGSATAFAVRGLKGAVSIGRADPLAIDLAATTQVGDRSGSLAVKGTLDRFLTAQGALDLQSVTGELDAQVSGWLVAAAGLNAEVQAAALRVQAPAGKPVGIAVNAAVQVEGGAMSAQAQMTASRPTASGELLRWAADPRTWVGQIAIKGAPTGALQRFVANTPLVLTREIGPTLDVSLQTGEGAGVDLSATGANLRLVARAVVDPATGAMQGNGISLQTSVDPALLAALGTTVGAPVQVSANLASLRTPPVATSGAFDVSAIAFDGTVQVQPFQMLQVGPQPIAFGALTIAAKADTIGTQVQASVNGSVQQAPIDVQAQVTGLGSNLSPSTAQVRGTIAAGPLDPTVLPALPAVARKWLGLVQPGATTVRASVAGSMQQGGAQAQLDMVPGSVALKATWDAESVQVQEVQSTLTVQPGLVSAIAGDSIALASPVQVQIAAGPVKAARSGALKFEAIPVRVQVPTLAIAKAPGLAGAANAKDLRVQGSVDPDGPTLFDGSVSVGGVAAAGVQGVGPVQVQSVAVQAKLPSDFKAVAIDAKVADVQCPRVPGITGLVGVRDMQATLAGPIDFGPGASASFKGVAHDASGTIATLQGTFEPQGAGWRASVQSGDVDMRRALGLLGQAATLPDWVGRQGSRSFAANMAGGAGGISFGVNASLDPIVLQAQGSRAASGMLTLTKGSLQAKLPDSVVKSLFQSTDTTLTQCDPLNIAVTVNALTLPADASGALQPFAPGSDIDLQARIEPWRVRAENSLALAFGANEFALKSRAGAGASMKLTGSLGAEGTAAAPLEVTLQTAQLLDEQGKFAPGRGSIAVVAHVKDFPTALADRLSGMDGSLVDMLGPSFTVDLTGRTGTTPQDFFMATFTSPTLVVQAPVVRLGGGVLSIAPDAPMTAELRPDERFRERILKPLNPIFADIETTQPLRASLQSLRTQFPVDVSAVQAAILIDIGDVAVRKNSLLLSVVDCVVASRQDSIPVKFMPLPVRLSNGLLTYDDFRVNIGKLNKDTWQYLILGEAQINLAKDPPYADFIDIRYPYSAIVSTAGKIEGARAGLAKVDQWLAAVPGAKDVVNSLQQKVRYSGPLRGGELQREFFPIHLPEGMGGKIIDGVQKGIGTALDDLFGKKK